MPTRCAWAGDDPTMVAYHDEEWGLPARTDQKMFEFLVLESAQAGLSWSTILNKRDGYRRAFAGFDMAEVAGFDDARVAELLDDSSIVRNRQKIEAAISNAKLAVEMRRAGTKLSDYFWNFVDGRPIVNKWRTMADIPAVTPLSEKMAKDMKSKGFRFFGPTIAYAHMQATGLVNDHVTRCFRWEEVQAS